MNKQIYEVLGSVSGELSPDTVRDTRAIFAPRIPPRPHATVVTEDIPYGPHARHRLDIYAPADAAGAPVLVFVHGGGFVGGDKRSQDGEPFFGNIGDFAARSGMVGVAMTYRLAPDCRWPSGSEDVAAAVGWLRSNVARFGGNPSRIIVMGQSAGAAHVAGYLAHPELDPPGSSPIAAAIMLSAIYEPATAAGNPMNRAYYGEPSAVPAAAGSTTGLIASDVPLLFGVAERDIPDFQRQAADFVSAYADARGAYPHMLYLSGHTHLSPVYCIGSDVDDVGPALIDFIENNIGD